MAHVARFLPRTRAIRILAGLTMAWLGTGCSHVYTVKVDALRTPEIAPRHSYLLVAADPESQAADPLFLQAQQAVAQVLDQHGLIPASRPEWADMVIELDLAVGHKRFVAVPDPAARDAAASAVYLPDRGAASVGEGTGVVAPPSAQKRVLAVWEKRLSLVACENLAGRTTAIGSGAQLWRVDVTLQDPSPSLDGVIPVLATALLDSIDRGTSTTIKRIPPEATEIPVTAQVR